MRSVGDGKAEFYELLPGREHVTVIEPRANPFRLDLRELWNYRDLVLLLVRRDFVAQYKQTILGPAWHIIQPLLTTLMFTIVFGKIARLPTDGLPPFLFYMAGTVIWTYFANVFTATTGTFAHNAHIFGKVYFPRLVMPLATLVSRLIAFAIQFAVFLGILAYFAVTDAAVQPNLWVLLTPVLLMMMAAIGLGGGLIVAAFTTRYRDLVVLVSFGVQLLMFATPIIYPLSSLPARWQFWASLNPIAPVVEAFRYAYLGQGTLSVGMLLLSALVVVLILSAGVVLFNTAERTFVDTV